MSVRYPGKRAGEKARCGPLEALSVTAYGGTERALFQKASASLPAIRESRKELLCLMSTVCSMVGMFAFGRK